MIDQRILKRTIQSGIHALDQCKKMRKEDEKKFLHHSTEYEAFSPDLNRLLLNNV